MKNTDLLNEYVINDQGAVFQGSSDKIGAKVWNLAQVRPFFCISSTLLYGCSSLNACDSEIKV